MTTNFELMQALLKAKRKHKVFISYYHNEGQYYKEKFENDFGHLFISKSVKPGDIATDVSDQYVKQLIHDKYMDDASVTIVLVGPKTYGRKHVDWEIYATLDKKVGGYSGLMAIMLPEMQLATNGGYYYADMPARLADNIKTKYANFYSWSWITTFSSYKDRVKTAIQEAFDGRVTKSYLIDNSREQLKRNLCS